MTKLAPLTVHFVGPMRGLPDWNYPAFLTAEAAWKQLHPKDKTTNPARNFDGKQDLPFEVYMQRSLEQTLAASAIVLLPGYEGSEGAHYEIAAAHATGKVFFEAYRTDGADGERVWMFKVIPSILIKSGPDLRVGPWLPSGAGIVTETANPERTQVNDSPRAQSLKRTMSYVCGDRNASYGPPTQDFKRTADLWNAFGFRFLPYEGAEPELIQPYHIANGQILLKQSRLAHEPEKADSWDDTSGYAACGHECVELSQ